MSDEWARQFIGKPIAKLAESLTEPDGMSFAHIATISYRAAAHTKTKKDRFTGGIDFDKTGRRYATVRFTHSVPLKDTPWVYRTCTVQLDVHQDDIRIHTCDTAGDYQHKRHLGQWLSPEGAAELFCGAIINATQRKETQ